MTLSELIIRFRTEANDKAAPYFWTDDEVTAWLNDAVAEAAIRGRLIHESADPDICRISVVEGESRYDLHPSLYELTHIALDGKPLSLVSAEALDNSVRGWRAEQGDPCYAVQEDKGLRLVPTPTSDGTLALEGYRLPTEAMEEEGDEPEIHGAHHRYLVLWALHKAFSIPDTEVFDPARAGNAEAEFTRHFGIRPDSDLRRITREDVPHAVEAFWV